MSLTERVNTLRLKLVTEGLRIFLRKWPALVLKYRSQASKFKLHGWTYSHRTSTPRMEFTLFRWLTSTGGGVSFDVEGYWLSALLHFICQYTTDTFVHRQDFPMRFAKKFISMLGKYLQITCELLC